MTRPLFFVMAIAVFGLLAIGALLETLPEILP